VVKALNTMTCPSGRRPHIVNGAQSVAGCLADAADAKKKQVQRMIESFGYSVIDYGNLRRTGDAAAKAGGPLAGKACWKLGERHHRKRLPYAMGKSSAEL